MRGFSGSAIPTGATLSIASQFAHEKTAAIIFPNWDWVARRFAGWQAQIGHLGPLAGGRSTTARWEMFLTLLIQNLLRHFGQSRSFTTRTALSSSSRNIRANIPLFKRKNRKPGSSSIWYTYEPPSAVNLQWQLPPPRSLARRATHRHLARSPGGPIMAASVAMKLATGLAVFRMASIRRSA